MAPGLCAQWRQSTERAQAHTKGPLRIWRQKRATTSTKETAPLDEVADETSADDDASASAAESGAKTMTTKGMAKI